MVVCTLTSTGTCWEDFIVEIVIDLECPTPLFSQLIEQIKLLVINDQLSGGMALPSIRQLANDLELNNKTVAKAYQLLERDSVLQMKGYRGTFVHPDAKKNCGVDLNKWLMSTLGETVSSLREAGLTDAEIRNGFQDIMNSKKY